MTKTACNKEVVYFGYFSYLSVETDTLIISGFKVFAFYREKATLFSQPPFSFQRLQLDRYIFAVGPPISVMVPLKSDLFESVSASLKSEFGLLL